MSNSTLQTLGALKALADIAVGEAALELAAELDAQHQADLSLKRQQSLVSEFNTMHQRLSQPGQALQPALLSQLAFGACEALSASAMAQVLCDEVAEQVDAKRGVLNAVQSRHDMVDRLHREARQAHRDERERLDALEREELFLSHRWAQGGRTWM